MPVTEAADQRLVVYGPPDSIVVYATGYSDMEIKRQILACQREHGSMCGARSCVAEYLPVERVKKVDP